jgi:glycerate 2-kinase
MRVPGLSECLRQRKRRKKNEPPFPAGCSSLRYFRPFIAAAPRQRRKAVMGTIIADMTLEEIFRAAIHAADPHALVRNYIENHGSLFAADRYRKVFVVGFGKASCPMAAAVAHVLPLIIDEGIVVTKYGHCKGYEFERISVYEAGHPLPDERGVHATNEIVNLLKRADTDTLVICLISGGGSALLVSPCEGLSLGDKQAITDLLLRSGATIHELNTVRKHLSRVKGGRLAELAWRARTISLIISDVMGDNLDVIASGPTSPDSTTYAEALSIVKRYGLLSQAPAAALEVLDRGVRGSLQETPKHGDRIFEKVRNVIIGNNGSALRAAGKRAGSVGFQTEIVSSAIAGEARDVGRDLARRAMQIKSAKGSQQPVCLISGGETTVTVAGKGRGGRNMELALSFASEIEGIGGISLLSAGTDGTDGPTDAAGAIVDGNTAGRGRERGAEVREYLENNDSYSFFKKAGGLFITGPTGTNVMDIQILAIE